MNTLGFFTGLLCDLGQLISSLWASISGLPVWIVTGLYPIILVPVIYFLKKMYAERTAGQGLAWYFSPRLRYFSLQSSGAWKQAYTGTLEPTLGTLIEQMHLCEWASTCVRAPGQDGTWQRNVSTGPHSIFLIFFCFQWSKNQTFPRAWKNLLQFTDGYTHFSGDEGKSLLAVNPHTDNRLRVLPQEPAERNPLQRCPLLDDGGPLAHGRLHGDARPRLDLICS